MSTQCLVIGAGAVGAVYGRHLAQGGADVTFYVREKYRAGLEAGIQLFHHNYKRKGIQTFTDFDLITSPQEVSQKKWDQVYITISSTALRSDGFKDILGQLNDDATLVLMQAGVEDFEYVSALNPESNIVQNLITLSSYQAPLEGEDLAKGSIAYWFPPGGSPVSGPKERAQAVAKALKQGKLGAKYTGDLDGVQRSTAYATSFFMPFLAALESNDWSFKKLRKSGDLKMVDVAAREAFAIMAQETGTKKPLAMSFLRSPVLKLGLLAQGWVVPFDLEAFFKYHFSKVKDQTVHYLNRFIHMGSEHSLPVDKLQTLYDRVK